MALCEAWCDALCHEMEARSGELLFESPDGGSADGALAGGVSAGGGGGAGSGEMLHETIYFGGGTPSILPEGILRRIFDSLRRNYRIAEGAECTIEVNPEDVTEERVALWRELGFNRISIGVQSFSPEELAIASRRHTLEGALEAVACAKGGGFDNIGIDLILGLSGKGDGATVKDKGGTVKGKPAKSGKSTGISYPPELTKLSRRGDLSNPAERAVAEVVAILRELPITHISLYLLSIEEGSILYKRVQNGEFHPLDDESEAELYLKYCDAFRGLGFEHYEISNFAKPGFRSRHNSSYWHQIPYIGFGPAAHSYDGARRRSWNLPSLPKYLDYWGPSGDSVPPAVSTVTAGNSTTNRSASATTSNSATIPETPATNNSVESLQSIATVQSGLQQSPKKQSSISCFEEEVLSDAELYNELIMTRLRTAEGLPLSILQERGFERFWSVARSKAEEYISQGYAELRNGALILNERGWLISDAIFSDLFADTE